MTAAPGLPRQRSPTPPLAAAWDRLPGASDPPAAWDRQPRASDPPARSRVRARTQGESSCCCLTVLRPGRPSSFSPLTEAVSLPVGTEGFKAPRFRKGLLATASAASIHAPTLL